MPTDPRQTEISVALAGYIRKHLKRFEANLQNVLSVGEVEAVHDVRVASRRLVESLRLAEVWGQKRRIARIARDLRRVRRALRRVRDYDVMLHSLIGPPAAPELEAHNLARLEGELTRRREKAISRTRRRLRRLQTSRTAAMIGEIMAGLREGATGDDQAMLADRINDHFHASVQRLMERVPTAKETANLHETRILLKRLRYSAELRRDVCGLDIAERHAAMVRMQDCLGAWNDHLAAAREVTRIARREEPLAVDTGWSILLLEYGLNRLRAAQEKKDEALRNWPGFAAAMNATEAVDSDSPSRRADEARHGNQQTA